MIYINNGQNTIKLPIYSDKIVAEFKLINNLSKVEAVYDVTNPTSTSITVEFTVVLSNLPVGEYTYSLLDNDGKVLSNGLAVYGNYTPVAVEYQTNNETKIYERQY